MPRLIDLVLGHRLAVAVLWLLATAAGGIATLVVRALLAPALVAVLGGVNWTIARWLGRALRTGPRGPRGRHLAGAPADTGREMSSSRRS
jgi:hypothetical protein